MVYAKKSQELAVLYDSEGMVRCTFGFLFGMSFLVHLVFEPPTLSPQSTFVSASDLTVSKARNDIRQEGKKLNYLNMGKVYGFAAFCVFPPVQ